MCTTVNIVGGHIIGKVIGYGIGAAFTAYGKVASYIATKRGPVVSVRAAVPEPGVPTGSHAASFENELFTRRVLQEEIIVYRAEGGKALNYGRYYGTEKPRTTLDAEEMSNIFKHGNTAERVVAYRIPAKTVVYEGRVAGGSGRQIYLEGAQAKGVVKISEEPLSFSTLDPNYLPGSILQ